MAPAFYLRDYIILYNLARKRLDSPEAYRAFQYFQGELLVRYLNSRGVDFKGKQVLDLACGIGGYSLALQDNGAHVVAVDRFLPDAPKGIQLIVGDALDLPFASNSFSLVICASLIEHVPVPTDLIEELCRVLDIGGIAYLSFPPFYTPIGGHQFSPFHLFGEHFALWLSRTRGLYEGKDWFREHYPKSPTSFSQAYGAWGLFPLTIGRVERMLRESSFRVIERSTRWLPFDVSSLPGLREFLTWHVQFLLKKER